MLKLTFVLMLKMILVLLILDVVVSVDSKLKIEVFFESLCPHSNMFISNQLTPTVKKFENEGFLYFHSRIIIYFIVIIKPIQKLQYFNPQSKTIHVCYEINIVSFQFLDKGLLFLKSFLILSITYLVVFLYFSIVICNNHFCTILTLIFWTLHYQFQTFVVHFRYC